MISYSFTLLISWVVISRALKWGGSHHFLTDSRQMVRSHITASLLSSANAPGSKLASPVESPKSSIVIGTRGSPLALAQAYETKKLLLQKFPNLSVDIQIFMTKVFSNDNDNNVIAIDVSCIM